MSEWVDILPPKAPHPEGWEWDFLDWIDISFLLLCIAACIILLLWLKNNRYYQLRIKLKRLQQIDAKSVISLHVWQLSSLLEPYCMENEACQELVNRLQTWAIQKEKDPKYDIPWIESLNQADHLLKQLSKQKSRSILRSKFNAWRQR